MTTVLLADDQELVRTGLRMILTAEDDLDGGRRGHRRPRGRGPRPGRLRPDIVLMDIRMPVLDGIEATRRITAAPGGTRVVMLTTFDRSKLVYDSLVAGASGFLLKDAPADQLVGGIRAIARGRAAPRRRASPAV